MRRLRRLLACLVAFTMVTSLAAPTIVWAAERHRGLSVGNGVVEYNVDSGNGRFTIKTVDGLPGKVSDNDKNLTFREEGPDTSFTTMRIDGKDYIFGQSVGILGVSGGLEGEPVTDGTLTTAIWNAAGVEVTQKLQLITDPANPNMGNVRITYEVRNLSDKTREVGSRILMDTMLGRNDASPMVLGSQYITNETLYEGDGVPGTWKSADERFAPDVVSFGMLSGWGNAAPDKLLIAHWESVSSTIWDYTPSELLNFTTDKNKYDSADSAVGLYWEPRSLKSGEEFTFETYYGLGSLSDSYSGSNFQVQVTAPTKLTVNAEGTAYNEKSFPVHVELDNNMDAATEMKNVKVELGFEEGLGMANGENHTQIVETIKQGERISLTFNMEAKAQDKLLVAPIGVTVTWGETVTEASKYIVLPSIKGPPPAMQMTGISPEKLYYKANQRKLIVKGSSFERLKADKDWELFLKHQDAGTTVPVSQKDVYIEDTALTVIIDPESKIDPGMYDVVLKTKNFGTLSQEIYFSTDKKYDRKEFGTLTVRKTEGDKFVHKIETWPSEEAMGLALSEEEQENILMILRGNLVTYELEGVQIYEAGPGTIINGAVKYIPPAGKEKSPIKLYKEEFYDADSGEQGEMLRMEGDGNLAIADYTFHYGVFYTELVDGTEYELPDPKVTDESYEGSSYGDESKEDVTIVTPANEIITNVANGIGKMLGFQVEVSDAVLGLGTVSLGGSVKLEVPMWAEKEDDDEDDDDGEDDDDKLSDDEKKMKERFDKNESIQGGFDKAAEAVEGKDDDDAFLAVNLEEMRYAIDANDRSYLEGFIADGKVKLDDSLIPNMELGVEAALGLNSLDYPGVYADIEAAAEVGDAFSCEVQIILVFETNGQTLPDAIKLVVSGDVIKIPLGGIGFLTKMGGGISGLYDTIKGGYKYVPPIMLTLYTGYIDPTGFAFELEDITMSVGGRGVEVKGENGIIVGLEIIEEIYGHVLAYDTEKGPAVDMGAGFKANLLGIVKGEASVWFIYDPMLEGIFGPVSLGGKAFVGIFIPDWIPLLGGFELLSVGAEVSTYRLFLGITIIGIPISVGYYWEDGQVIFGDTFEGKRKRSLLAPVDGLPQELIDNALYVETTVQDGTKSSMVFGSNLRTTYSSPLPEGDLRMRSGGPVSHVIPVQNQDYSLFQLEFKGEMPEISVKKPNGDNYELIKDQNMMVQTIAAEHSNSGEDEHYVFISVEKPEDGNWTIQADAPIGCVAKDVEAIPEIKNIKAKQTENGTASVTWNTVSAKETDTVNLYLSEDLGAAPAMRAEMDESQAAEYNKRLADSYDAGLLLKSGIPAKDGSATVEIPDTMSSGNYKIRASLISGADSTGVGGDAVSSAMGTDVFHYTNPNTPPKPTDVKVELGGDGMFEVTYDCADTEAIDGYLITVLDESGRAMAEVSPVTADKTSNKYYVGGTYKATVANAEGKAVASEELQGVIPGKSYRVQVETYRSVGSMTYPSEAEVSDPILLPLPNPAALEISMDGKTAVRDNAAGKKAASTQGEDPTLKVTVTTPNPIMTIEADQNSEALLMLNGRLMQTAEAYELEAGKPLEIPLIDLVEGENKVTVVSQNSARDFTNEAVIINVDTTPPEFMLQDVVPTSVNGQYTLTGTAEPNASIYVGDSATPLVRKGGTFSYVGTTDQLMDTVALTAVDGAGNETRMEVDVIASELAGLQRMELRRADGSALTDSSAPTDLVKLEKGEELALAAYGISAKADRSFRLPDRMLTWEVLAGGGRCTIDQNGVITTAYPGEAVIACSFKLTDNYSLEQTATLEIADVFTQPNTVRISTETIDTRLGVGSAIALLSVPGGTTGVSYVYSLSGSDASTFRVEGNRLILNEVPDESEINITITAQGTHILNGKTENIGEAFSTNFSLRSMREIVSVAKQEDLRYRLGRPFGELELPKTVEATLSDGSTQELAVTWRQGTYRSDLAGKHLLRGILTNSVGVSNGGGVEAELYVTLYSPPKKPILPEEPTVIIPVKDDASNGIISATLTPDQAKEALKNAGKSTETIAVMMDAKSGSNAGVTGIRLTLQPETIMSITGTGAKELKVISPLGTVSLPRKAINSLQNGEVIISMDEKSGGLVSVGLTSGGKALDKVSGGLKMLLETKRTSPGTVAVIMNDKGKTEVIRKSIVREGVAVIPLEGPATVKLIDNTKTFADVKADDWYAAPVNFAAAHELFSGTAQNQFSPNGAMNRAMLVTVLHNMENKPAGGTNSFADVPAGAYYGDAVSWANKNKIVAGTGSGFEPKGWVTREEVAVILYNYAKSMGQAPAANGTLESFSDAKAVSPWATDAMQYAVSAGILKGTDGGALKPGGYATRAEVAAMLLNYLEYASK